MLSKDQMGIGPSRRDERVYSQKLHLASCPVPARLSLLHTSHVLASVQHSLQPSQPWGVRQGMLLLTAPTSPRPALLFTNVLQQPALAAGCLKVSQGAKGKDYKSEGGRQDR